MKKNRTVLLNIFMVIAAAMMVFLPLSVQAQEIDTAKKGDITLKYDPDQSGSADGTVFRIYKVADVGTDGKISSAGTGFTVNSQKMDSGEAKRLAELLKNETPAYTATIRNGTALVENVPVGIYLLVGEEKQVGNKTFTPIPSFFSIPQETAGTFTFGPLNIEVKFRSTSLPDSKGTVKYKVTKKWAGDNESIRPTEITVAIIEGTTQKETVVLNKANNWTYEWNGTKGVSYKVIEKNIPAGYSVTQTGNETSFILTNTYTESTPTPTPASSTPPGTNPAPNTGDRFNQNKLLVILGISLCIAGVVGVLLHRN
ncbi:MAG: Cna B-type domain-containing protein [Solobacterium sp.]|nr:Cna B-type domain-containing protein [Solobacterium sp.]